MNLVIIIGLILILAAYWYIIGFGVEIISKKTIPHKIVVGFFAYFTLYGIITIPLGVLHVPWVAFFWILTVFNLVLLGSAIVLIYRRKIYPKFSGTAIKQYIHNYWPVLLIMCAYMCIYLMSDFSIHTNIYRGAFWDHSYYAAKANEAIGSFSILAVNPKYGQLESFTAVFVNSTVTWELFWSYLSSLTGLTVNQISKLVLPIYIYTVIFMSIDMFFSEFQAKREKKFNRSYLIIFWCMIVYTTANDLLQDEVSKFMYFPWFGNVLVTMLFIFSTVYLFKRALTNKTYFILLLAQLVFYNIFSLGGLMYAAILYPLLLIYWFKKKTYKFKYDKILLILGLLFFGVINIFYISSQKTVIWIEQDRWLSYFQVILPLFVFSGAGVALLFINNKITHFEKSVLFFFILIITLLILEPSSKMIFGEYKFALHRFAMSIMIFFLMYGMTGFLAINIKKYVIVGMIPMLLVAQKNYDFFIVKNRDALRPQNILNIRRESSEVIQTANFLNQKAKDKQRPVYYCAYGSDAYASHDKRFKTKYYDTYADVGSMVVTETKNVYEAHYNTDTENRDLKIYEFESSKCEYLLTDSDAVVRFYEQQNKKVVQIIQSDILIHELRIIELKA